MHPSTSIPSLQRQASDACHANRVEHVLTLIRRGCDPNVETSRGLTPLLCAGNSKYKFRTMGILLYTGVLVVSCFMWSVALDSSSVLLYYPSMPLSSHLTYQYTDIPS